VSSNYLTKKCLELLQSSEFWGATTYTNDRYVGNLTCPRCWRPEAFHYIGSPWITCNRRNNCGARSNVKELLPNPYAGIEEENPPTEDDPHRPARVYLESRGFRKALEGLDYEYRPNVRGTGKGAAMFTVGAAGEDTAYNGRIFDPPKNEGKTHNIGSTSGKIWRHTGIAYDQNREIIITEGICDALAWVEMGFQAIAVLSAGADPNKLDLAWIGSPVLAFDNDQAGIKALKRFSNFFEGKNSNGRRPSAILCPQGDWNDFLLAGPVDGAQDRFEKQRPAMEAHAALALAKTAQKYAEVYYKEFGRLGLFVFNGNYYYSTVKERKEGTEVKTKHVADFTIEVHHFKVNDSDSDDTFTYHLQVTKCNGETRHITVTAKELSTPYAMKAMFLGRAKAHWKGDTAATEALIDLIVSAKAKEVRQLEFTGYDRESGCYVYPTHMIPPNGELVLPNEKGFFDVASNKSVHPAPYNFAILPSNGVQVSKLYELMLAAWGFKAALAIAWVVASWFVNQIKKEIGFFPFLSLYGDSQTGKSNMVRILNAFQCMDEEGMPMSKTNTAKGELRKIAQRSGAFIAMLEWPQDPKMARFSIDQILTMFNECPLQVRALKTADNRTHEIPFYGAMMFVQNVEPQKTKPQKERVVSCEFRAEDLNENTWRAFRELENTSLSDKASFFREVMSHRQTIESEWHTAYGRAQEELQELDTSSRIRETHGLILGFHYLLCTFFGFDVDLVPYLTDIMRKKELTCATEPETVADHFLSILLSLPEPDSNKDFIHIAGNALWIQKPNAEKAIREQGYTLNASEMALSTALSNHPAFIRRNTHRFGGKSMSGYLFDYRKLREAYAS